MKYTIEDDLALHEARYQDGYDDGYRAGYADALDKHVGLTAEQKRVEL